MYIYATAYNKPELELNIVRIRMTFLIYLNLYKEDNVNKHCFNAILLFVEIAYVKSFSTGLKGDLPMRFYLTEKFIFRIFLIK